MSNYILTIELVPKTSWYSNVRSNVTSTQWSKIKKDRATLAGYKCEICNGTGFDQGIRWAVECHEIWEYDDKNHIQKLKSMTSLCPRCHEVKHIGLAAVRGKLEYATQHFMAVNGVSSDEAEDYIIGCFEEHAERSKHEWALDLDHLEERYNIKVKK